MTIKNRYAALCAIPALAALALPTTPALAAAPKAPAKPVLTCKTKAAEGLTYTVLKASKGAKPTDDARVVVNYRGFLKSDGSEFDSGEGAKFRVTGVIPGFSQGLKLMAPGSKYRLCIPSAIGYGEEGSGPIPANADLVFEVELLSFETLPPKPAVPADARACDKTTATGLSYAIGKTGMGATPAATDMALIDLTTFDPATGTILGKQLWERIAVAQATPMFTEALGLMQVGGSYRFCMPKKDDPEGGQSTPALNFIVDLIDVRPAPVEEEG
ncbi:FKBP-type peptidyl-prolyl cis-trans isomerase [Sphingorhabdus sp.]|uniref:FKBP-type peptidyl-prolyl cis-trans isomerase n=1 Tax=Sphingorhabdus sp. TaxID=1902408 RepID=UPI003C7782DF